MQISQLREAAGQVHHLAAIKVQVCEWVPQKKLSNSDPIIIEAADLLKLIMDFRDSAIAVYHAEVQQLGCAQVGFLRVVHDATILCCLFGWLPLMRSSMLITLLVPD